MKMIVESKDIYDVQIDDIDTGDFQGCPEGYSDFNVDVDDVTQDDDITIEISGKCKNFGYHDSMPCTFTGTLTMNENDFTYEYTNAAEDCAKYIKFDGSIKISLTSGKKIELDDDDVEDTFEDTISNIRDKVEEELYDGSYILRDVIRSIIIDASDKVIEEIKHIDNTDITINNDNWDEYVDYVIKNIIDEYCGELLDNKYKSIDAILNAQTAEDIKNDNLASFINDELEDVSDESTETFEITTKVFFSDLDP